MARRLGLAVLLLPANAWPQSLELSSVVTIAHGDHRVDAGLGVERATGLLVGGATRLRYGGIALTLSGETGHLTAVQGSGGIDRDVSQIGAVAQFAPLSWLTLESGVTLRSFGTVLARQRWTLVRAGAEARIPLSGETFWAVGHAHLLPVVSVNELPNAASAFDAGTGLAYRRGRLLLELTYTLERCDFPSQGSTRRSEQLGTLALGGGVQLRLR
ncbi:MAG TPA: hypothetical protein VEK77_03575 [Gemmatimonadales bacterium]|nr:hypothetical protein [Gemmatimonadales bacterium]